MATWQWYTANYGIHAFFWETDSYEIVQADETKVVLEYDEDLGGEFEPWRNPWEIEFTLKDAVLVEWDEDPNGDPDVWPDVGDEQFTSGIIESVRMFNEDGDLLLKITDVAVPLVAVNAWHEMHDDFDDVFRVILNADSTFTGSDNLPEGEGDHDDYDEIRTGPGDDLVDAGDGDDWIVDFGGADMYDGGDGSHDVLSYEEVFWNPWIGYRGIDADLDAGTIVGFDGEMDAVTGIEQLRGTFYDDVMKGDGENNRFNGLAGDDFFNGRGGWDELRYDRDADRGGHLGIQVDMGAKTVRDGFGTVDTFLNIEAIRGTDYADDFKDTKGAQSFDGREGDDVFRFTKGADVAKGGDGADTFIYKNKVFGSNRIEDFDVDEGDLVCIKKAADLDDLMIKTHADGALIKFSNKSKVILEGIDHTDIDASWFIF